MNSEEIRELAAGYALGGLDGDDRGRFEALLRAGDQEAAAALREFEATLAELAAESAEAPPTRVKATLMARAAREEDTPPAGATARPVPARALRKRSRWPAVWAAAMAGGIAAIAVGLVTSGTYERRASILAREAAALRAELGRQQAVVTLLRDPATQIVSLSGLDPAPSARARMIWNGAAGGLLVAAGLPDPPEGNVYQLWAIAGRNAPVSAGVFTVDARGTGSLDVPRLPGVDKVDVFAVTLEPAGGLPAPSGRMYLAGKS